MNYILDNIFDLITIAVSVYVIVRHEFTPYGPNDISDLITWLLAILGLLAISALWERHRRLRKIESVTNQTYDLVARKLGGQIHASDFFWGDDEKISTDDISQAKNIFIVGMILNRAVRDHLSLFENRLTAGANLKFVLLDYNDEFLMKIMPFRSYGNRPSGWWRSRIQQTVEHIEDIPNGDVQNGSIEIGFLSYFPSFGMWLIDPDEPQGQIIVEIYHHRSSELNPTFRLRASQDTYWYSFFRHQFELFWKSCEEKGKVRNLSSDRTVKKR